MTVMGDASVDRLSDRGSIPLSSTCRIHHELYINMFGEYDNFLHISPDNAFLLVRTFLFYI